ncbi:MAG: class I SAM-dependent methyltransferase [Terriglobia bacterium]
MKPASLSGRLANLDSEKLKLVERLLARKNTQDPRDFRNAEARSNHVPPFDEEALQSFSSPAGRTKAGTKKFYDKINQQLSSTIFGEHSTFLNYGYVADGSPQQSQVELPRRLMNRTSIMLVLELIGSFDLTGKRLLDVGCGRGGALAVINEFFSAALKTGIDLSSEAAAFSRKTHRYPHTYFVEGDAEQLPFGAGAFDVVTNIESSHSYPAVSTFYSEVNRVLLPGGYFLYTDVFSAADFDDHRQKLRQLGFTIEQDRDVTRNVLLSCRETAEVRSRAFVDVAERGVINNFLSTPGSAVFEAMRSGNAAYRIFRIRKD